MPNVGHKNKPSESCVACSTFLMRAHAPATHHSPTTTKQNSNKILKWQYKKGGNLAGNSKRKCERLNGGWRVDEVVGGAVVLRVFRNKLQVQNKGINEQKQQQRY